MENALFTGYALLIPLVPVVLVFGLLSWLADVLEARWPRVNRKVK
jgi:hypothetical protein